MQAEHIPVHLGAMPAAVEAVRDEDHEPGRSWILNDPFAGGTHLPDITVVTPVFLDDTTGESPLLGFAASRAHHADVGGRVPGSMPADSTTLEEEGVVIPPRPLTPHVIDELVAQMRQPAQRRADLRAQLAANQTGARRLAELARRLGHEQLAAGVEHRRDDRDVGQVGAARERVVEHPRRAVGVVLARDGGDRVGHRAEVDGDVLGLHDELAVGVEERARGVAALLDVRGVARADQHRAHLLADRAQSAGGDAQRDRVQAHRSIRIVPDSSTSPLQPGGTASVASRSSTTAGPSIRSPGAGSPRMISVSP